MISLSLSFDNPANESIKQLAVKLTDIFFKQILLLIKIIYIIYKYIYIIYTHI